MRRSILILNFLLSLAAVFAQRPIWRGDSWHDVQQHKSGSITALWYDIEPFIYVGKENILAGVEYEIMESFKDYVNQKYGVQLQVNWQNAGAFDSIYSAIKGSSSPGLIGWSYFSITEERKKEVKFTPPYMTDLNVLITNNAQPFFTTSQEFTSKLNDMRAYTMKNTTMEEDVISLKNNFYKGLKVDDRDDDYLVMQEVSENEKAFGYVALSVYIVGLQKGIKVKRQNILTNRREGFAGIMPLSSDWQPVWDEFFNMPQTKMNTARIISKYLGAQVGDLVITASKADSSNLYNSNMELLSLEKEIVTQRVVDAAIYAQRQKTIRNILIAVGCTLVLLSAILYNRFKVKQKLTKSLQQRNDLIAAQNEQIERMNQQLKIKILQSKLNPHFLFNSLNSIQYFINENDRKGALQYIQRFSRFLRQVLASSDELLIPVHQEATLLEQYLWLEQNRFPGRFNYEVKVKETAADENTLMPPLLTHSIAEELLYLCILNDGTTGTHFISIEFGIANNMLEAEIKCNGIDRDRAIELHRSKGLQHEEEMILEKRLELINYNNVKAISVSYHFDEANAINTCVLTIPQT